MVQLTITSGGRVVNVIAYKRPRQAFRGQTVNILNELETLDTRLAGTRLTIKIYNYMRDLLTVTTLLSRSGLRALTLRYMVVPFAMNEL